MLQNNHNGHKDIVDLGEWSSCAESDCQRLLQYGRIDHKGVVFPYVLPLYGASGHFASLQYRRTDHTDI